MTMIISTSIITKKMFSSETSFVRRVLPIVHLPNMLANEDVAKFVSLYRQWPIERQNTRMRNND